MNAALSFICVAGCAVGTLLITMLLTRINRSHANATLAFLIAAACIDLLLSAAEYLSLRSVPASLQLTTFPGLLLAPTLYLFFRIQASSRRLHIKDLRHLTSFAALQSIAIVQFARPSLLPWASVQVSLKLVCMVVIGVYVLAIARFTTLTMLLRDRWVFHNSIVAQAALIIAVASYFFKAGGALIFSPDHISEDVAHVILSCSLVVLACSAIHRSVSREADANIEQSDPSETKQEPTKIKYGNNRLPDFIRKSIIAELNRYMQSEQPWLKTDLTLSQLAASINVNPHHLSQIINSEFGKSFACYINEFRVNAACRLLSVESDKSVLDIALDSGFSSKSSFNALFKKHTGTTPSQYRSQFQKKNYLVDLILPVTRPIR